MKKTLVSIALLGATLTIAQVGINTEEPKATLDVVASPADMTLTDGFIAPRLTGDEMKAKDGLYTDVTGQTGAIVYATTASSDAGVTGTKTINVDGAGYYYFDGTVWVKFGSGVAAPVTNDWHITGNTDIVAGTNFLGTTSANKVALEFRVNGERAGYIGDDNTNTVGAQGLYKTTLGYQAGMGTTGDRVTAIGNHALSLNTAQNNTAIGAFALQNNVTGQNNMAVGDHALRDNTSRRNSAIGSNALNSNTTGEGNTAIGYRANASNVAGSFNTFIGSQAGEGVLATGAVTDANSSIAIGRGTTMGAGLTNAMVIGAYGSVTQSNSMVLGALPGTYAGVTVGATKVGIGVTAPTNTLHVVATADPLKLEGLQAGTAGDKIVVANATGVLKTIDASAIASATEPWNVQNTSTQATANTENIYQQGKVAIGFSSTDAVTGKQFEVKGDAKMTSSVTGGTTNTIDTKGGLYGNGMTMNSQNTNGLASIDVWSQPNEGLILLRGQSSTEQTSVHVEAGRLDLHNKSNGYGETNIEIQPALTVPMFGKGVTFSYRDDSNNLIGRYTFPTENGTANQVLTSPGPGNQLFWSNVAPAVSNNLSGTGNAYACINPAGQIYRSATPCTP